MRADPKDREHWEGEERQGDCHNFASKSQVAYIYFLNDNENLL